MTAQLTRLMDNLRVRLPGAVDAAIKLELFNALKEFFDDSNSWYEDVTFAVTPGTLEYEVEPNFISQVVRLYGVANSADRIVPAVYNPPGEIELLSDTNQADTYTARFILTVSDPVTRDDYPTFPEWVASAYSDEIMDGVLGRMMSQIAKPYSNERMAIYHMRRFRNGIARARVDALRKFTYGRQAWRFPQTFARRRAR